MPTRPLKSITLLPFALLIAASACTVGYAPPPPAVGGHPDMTGWRLMGDAWVTGPFERQVIPVGKYEGPSRASCWSSPTPPLGSATW